MKQTTLKITTSALSTIAAISLLSAASSALAHHRHSDSNDDSSSRSHAAGLTKEVIAGTRRYLDWSAATGDGYASNRSCVSGPNLGAMGVHFSNGTLIMDAELDPRRPEALIYEYRHHRLRLVGVEFIVLQSVWEAANGTGPLATPSLMGQRFNFVGAPNRYGLEPLYELHVWAWRENPLGTFVDWNPDVSCDEYTPQADF